MRKCEFQFIMSLVKFCAHAALAYNFPLYYDVKVDSEYIRQLTATCLELIFETIKRTETRGKK